MDAIQKWRAMGSEKLILQRAKLFSSKTFEGKFIYSRYAMAYTTKLGGLMHTNILDHNKGKFITKYNPYWKANSMS